MTYYYRPKRSFGQGNIFTPVCHSFCSQGGEVPDQAPPPQDQAGTPPDQTPPGSTPPPPTRQVHPQEHNPQDQAGTPPGADTPPPQTRQVPPPTRPPLPGKQQTPEYGQRSAGTHPTGMHSCFSIGFGIIGQF